MKKEPRMNTNGTRMKLVVAASLLAVVVGAIVVLWPRDERKPVTEPSVMLSGKKPVFVLMPTPVPARLDKTPPQVLVEAVGEEKQKVIQVKANQILATVNRIPVTLKDLVGEGRSEARLSVEEYEYLLGRAIDREAAIQAALSQGVTLTDGQMRQLESIHGRVMAGEVEKDGSKVSHVNATGSVEERAMFAVRDAAGLMLIVNLMAKSGLPLDAPEQRSSYIKARAEFLANLRADHVVAMVTL
jgi:hypothetical protein